MILLLAEGAANAICRINPETSIGRESNSTAIFSAGSADDLTSLLGKGPDPPAEFALSLD